MGGPCLGPCLKDPCLGAPLYSEVACLGAASEPLAWRPPVWEACLEGPCLGAPAWEPWLWPWLWSEDFCKGSRSPQDAVCKGEGGSQPQAQTFGFLSFRKTCWEAVAPCLGLDLLTLPEKQAPPLQCLGAASFRVVDRHRCRASKPNQ